MLKRNKKTLNNLVVILFCFNFTVCLKEKHLVKFNHSALPHHGKRRIMKNVETLVEEIKIALTNNSFNSAAEWMAIVNNILDNNNCKTIETATKFCEVFNVEYGNFTCEHIIDRDSNSFSVNGYTLILSAISLCDTQRYYVGVFTKDGDRKDKARTVNNY